MYRIPQRTLRKRRIVGSANSWTGDYIFAAHRRADGVFEVSASMFLTGRGAFVSHTVRRG